MSDPAPAKLVFPPEWGIAMSVLVLVIITVIILLCIVALRSLRSYYAHDQILRRDLRQAKRSRIGDLPEHQIGRIVGRASRLERQLLAPLTGRACLAWSVVVESSGQHGGWHEIVRDHRGVPFLVVDETGRALVDPRGARVSLEIDSSTQSGAFDDPTPTERAFLAEHRKAGKWFGFNRPLRYSEAIIEDGEVVALCGAGVREPDPGAPSGSPYRGEPPMRLRMSGTRKFPLLISDAAETTGE